MRVVSVMAIEVVQNRAAKVVSCSRERCEVREPGLIAAVGVEPGLVQREERCGVEWREKQVSK